MTKLIGISRSKIHYHLKELEIYGFIKVAKAEVKNGITLKFYLSVAKIFIPEISLFNSSFLAGYKDIFVKKEKVEKFKNDMVYLIEKYRATESMTTEKIILEFIQYNYKVTTKDNNLLDYLFVT